MLEEQLLDSLDFIAGQNQFLRLNSLATSSAAFWITYQFKNRKSPILIIVETYDDTEQVKEELEFFTGKGQVDRFPHWDILPYDQLSPEKEVIAERLGTLSKIATGKSKFIVTTPNALMQKLMPPQVLLQHSFFLKKKDIYDRNQILNQFTTQGYVRVDLVEDKGEFSVKGEIIDVFPINQDAPFRLGFFDDELETIKSFDIESQKSVSVLETVEILPAHEIVLNKETQDRALKNLFPLKGTTSPQNYSEVLENIQSGKPFSGIEHLIPLYFETCVNLLDYFTTKPLLVFYEKTRINSRAKDYFDEIGQEYELSKSQEELTLDTKNLYLNSVELEQQFSNLRQFDLSPFLADHTQKAFNFSFVDNAALATLAIDPKQSKHSVIWQILRKLSQWHAEGIQIAISANTISEADRLKPLFQEFDQPLQIEESEEISLRNQWLLNGKGKEFIQIFVASLPRGFRVLDQNGDTKLALIAEEEIFGKRKKQKRPRKSTLKQFLSSMATLREGDFVVHVEYGIGRYEGLKKIKVQDVETDYLIISYSGGDKVYVSVDKFHLVQKYAGVQSSAPKLNKLGDKTWSKTKIKVKHHIQDLAKELIQIYAQQGAKKGIVFSSNHSLMDEFSLSFQFQETEDQEAAIQDVFQDMESESPMDRLVCGDVGFGKTEVAMRAAFKGVLDHYQVGMLVPTTILAQQHYETFQKRFKEFPVNIELLSRFRSPKQIKETIERMKNGKVDIVIGTHRILSKDVGFSNLGILIVDEEQRFGVRHKERIKKFRSTVEVLTLSATPIPRTLYMSLIGIRDISVINTPPIDRRVIRTRVLKFSDYLIKESIERELRRKGQVYFIHNRVESIYQIRNYLKSILPNASLRIGHGQMSERELEDVMHDFVNGKFQILVATTIVESGLDISNANTIIINNADKFGLSQLYQLRGRVGRSNQQAYAYLLTPKDKVLTEIARKRLGVLQELNDLGSGYKIASHDLELRGAGDILGSSQSGHVSAVGFKLYTNMIEEEVRHIKIKEKMSQDKPNRDIKLNYGFPSCFPDNYIESTNQRLEAYRDISACKIEEDLWVIRENIEDRFGKMPQTASHLFYSIQIKIIAEEISAKQIDINSEKLDLTFYEDFQPDPNPLFDFIYARKGKVLPDNRIRFKGNFSKIEITLELLKAFKKEFIQ